MPQALQVVSTDHCSFCLTGPAGKEHPERVSQ